MKMKVTLSRDADMFPRKIEIQRGRKKLKVKQEKSPDGDVYSFEIEGRRADLPSFVELLTIVNARRLDRIGTIDEIKLITEIVELTTLKTIQSIASLPNVTLVGSEGIAVKQATAGAGAWTDPDGFTDPDGKWNTEANAYDNNTATVAWSTIAGIGWGSFIHFTLAAAIRSNIIRYYVDCSSYITKIDVDVKKDGTWIDVYEGEFTEDVYIQKEFAEGMVDEIRIRYYHSVLADGIGRVNEVDLWRVPLTGGELEIVDVTPP